MDCCLKEAVLAAMMYLVLADGNSAINPCAPCVCNSSTQTMECFDLPYIVRPSLDIRTVHIHRADFGSFDQPNLANLSGLNIKELRLVNCKLSNVTPRKLFSGLRNLKVLRLNRTVILPEELGLAFYSLGTTKIRQLYLDDLDHAPLPSHFFDGLKSCRVSLVSLRLNSIRNLWLLDRTDIFQGLPGLQTLILSENQIATVEDNTFAGLRVLRHLFLDFNNIKSLKPAAFRIPLLVTLSLAQNGFKFSSLGNTDKIFSHLTKLKVLNISGNDLRGVTPENLALLFGNLSEVTVLKLGRTGLTFLPAGMFRGLQMLREIYLEGNQLKTWTPQTFSKLDNLEVVYINKNKIQTVSLEQLYSVVNRSQPVHINLASNPFSCTCALVGFLRWLGRSTEKAVGYPEMYTCESPFALYQTKLNQVIFTKEECFHPARNYTKTTKKEGLPCYPCQCEGIVMTCFGPSVDYIPPPPSTARKVVLDSVQFEIVNQNVLGNLTGHFLTDLDIINCTINSQSNDTFFRLSSLQALNMSASYITPVDVAAGLSSLGGTNITELHLDNLHLKRLPPNTFDNLRGRNLVTLSIANNMLSSIPADGRLFRGLNRLRYLDLSHNLIRSVSNNSFQGLTSLRHLRLDSNRIRTAEFWAVGLKSLTHLWFANNRYNFLPSNVGQFCHVTSLQVLDLSGNDLSKLDSSMTEDLFKTLRDLRILSLRNTRLRYLYSGMLFNKSRLRALDLRNNRISQINPEFITGHETLRTLSLRANEIQTVTKDVLEALTKSKLLKLNLAKNPMDCSCDLVEFLHWINTTQVTLIDYPHNYSCAKPSREYGKLLSDFQPPDNCFATIHRLSLASTVVVSLASVISVALMVGVSAAVYLNRKGIWLSTVRFKARLRSQRLRQLQGDT